MPSFFYILKSLWEKKTLVRTVLNYRLTRVMLTGKVIDLGAGGVVDYYTRIIPRESHTQFSYFDQKQGDEIDFEYDRLPFGDNSYDQVLFMNVLEHIYNYQFILREIHRIKKTDGYLLGFVPFLKWYHADPHDYFRYTHESLEIMLKDAGFTEIKIEPLCLGPYQTAFDMILPTVPRILRPILYTPCFLLDKLFIYLRNEEAARRYVLGYYFTAF